MPNETYCVPFFDLSKPWSIEFGVSWAIFSLCVLGAFGNVLNIIVLNGKPFRTNPTYVHLNILATVQLSTLVALAASIICLAAAGAGHVTFGYAADRFFGPMFANGVALSYTMTVIYTIERLRYVREVKNHTIFSASRARTSSWASLGAITLLNLPWNFSLTFNDQAFCLVYRWRGDWFWYYSLVRFFIFNIGFLGVLLVSNFVLISFLANRDVLQKQRLSATSSLPLVAQSPSFAAAPPKFQQKSVTKTVISTTFLALFCELCVTAFNPITEAYTWSKLGMAPDTSRYLRLSTLVALAIQYSGNFFLYYVANRRFNKSLRDKFSLCRTC